MYAGVHKYMPSEASVDDISEYVHPFVSRLYHLSVPSLVLSHIWCHIPFISLTTYLLPGVSAPSPYGTSYMTWALTHSHDKLSQELLSLFTSADASRSC